MSDTTFKLQPLQFELLIEEIKEEVKESKIAMPDSMRTDNRDFKRGRVVAVGYAVIEILVGDTVYFKPDEKIVFEGNTYYVVNQERIKVKEI